MKISFVNKFLGSVLVIAAVVLTGYNLEWWKFGVNYDNAWTLIVAVPFLVWMLIFGVNLINSFGFYSGIGLMIYYKWNISDENIPVFIIIMSMLALGTTAIGNSYKYIKPDSLEPVTLSRTSPDIKVFAGMKHLRNNFKGIIGGSFRVFSGSLLYDFRRAEIDDNTEMNVKVRFGKLYLVFNDDIMVESNVDGNFINGLAAPRDYSRIIKIKGKVRFGKLFIIHSQSQDD